MNKKIYLQPSVKVTEVCLKYNLCYEISGEGSISDPGVTPANPGGEGGGSDGKQNPIYNSYNDFHRSTF